MPPSQESQALATLFTKFAANMPEDNVFISRAIYDQVQSAGSEASGVTLEESIIANRSCIWFYPANASKSHVILFLHGGGFTIGSPTGHRKVAAHLAKACNYISVSIDYRLAPEHVYPAGLDDCVNAYKALLDQGFDAKKIVVAGDSCGGGLSASVPLAAAKKGLPVPGAAVSLSPWYDLSSQEGGTMVSNSEHDVLQTAPFVGKLAQTYIGNSGASLKDPLISPLLASDEELKTLPPTWISAGGYDMLRDHGERMADRLKNVGKDFVLEVHDGQQHVMEFMVGKAPEATSSIRAIGEWVRGQIGS